MGVFVFMSAICMCLYECIYVYLCVCVVCVSMCRQLSKQSY